MGEMLCKTKGYAAWVTAFLTVFIQITLASYGYGVVVQRQSEFDHRLAVIEANDRDQARQLSDVGSQLARIGEGIVYIKDALRDHQKRTEAGGK